MAVHLAVTSDIFGGIFFNCPFIHEMPWMRSELVVGLGFNGPLRQYVSLYRVAPMRGRQRREKIEESKMSKQPLPAPYASAIDPFPTIIQIVGRPGTGSIPEPITPG